MPERPGAAGSGGPAAAGPGPPGSDSHGDRDSESRVGLCQSRTSSLSPGVICAQGIINFSCQCRRRAGPGGPARARRPGWAGLGEPMRFEV